MNLLSILIKISSLKRDYFIKSIIKFNNLLEKLKILINKINIKLNYYGHIVKITNKYW